VADWSFLTNHARVLLCIAHDPGVRLRDIAARTRITERTAYGIVVGCHLGPGAAGAGRGGWLVRSRRWGSSGLPGR
jgi:hypothetical protein